MSVLGSGKPPFGDDDGSADPQVAATLAAFASGVGSEHAALTALARSRLLVPVVAVVSEGAGRRTERGDRGSEMSLPTLIGRDGRPAIPAFTCLDALARWDGQARPVPAPAGRVWRAAVDGGCAVVVDIAGPVPLAIAGSRLAALADGRPVPPPHRDPDVLAAVRAAADGQPAIASLRIAGSGPGSGLAGGGDPGVDPAAGNDLRIDLTLAARCDAAAGDEAVRLLGRGLMEQLGERLRRGIAIAVSRPAGDRES